MKKTTLFILVATMISASMFTSCNKKLKEDIKELDGQVNELKTQNETLQNQANGISSILGSNEPITATTSFLDDNNNTQTWTDTYSFKSNGMNTQYMEDNGDGTFDIYIERFSDVEWSEGAWVRFTYNSSTGAITNKGGGQYWDWNLPYNDNTYYYEYYTGCTVDITISSINTSTGAIALSFAATANDAAAANYNNVPNNDKGATTTFSFTGTLKIYTASSGGPL